MNKRNWKFALAVIMMLLGSTILLANEAEFVALEIEDVQYSASSYLVESDKPVDKYAPHQIGSGGAKTSWCEGVKGPGKGEYIEISFAPTEVSRDTGILILNGYGRTKSLYYANNRVKKLEVAFQLQNGQEIKKTIQLQDGTCGYNELCGRCQHYGSDIDPNCPSQQQCDEQCDVSDGYEATGGEFFYLNVYDDLRKRNGILSKSEWNRMASSRLTGVRLTIRDVYKGKKYDDTCIAHFMLTRPVK